MFVGGYVAWCCCMFGFWFVYLGFGLDCLIAVVAGDFGLRLRLGCWCCFRLCDCLLSFVVFGLMC